MMKNKLNIMKNKNFILGVFIFGIFAIFSLIGCENKIEKIDDDFLGHQYYPIAIGNEWVYKLDSFLYSNEGIYKDTSHWYVKEAITEVHQVGTEEGNYVLERSLSKDSVNWRVSDIWTISMTNADVKKKEENHTFIKLVFPPKIGKAWDGNAFIDEQDTVSVFGENFRMFENWDYQITEKLGQFDNGEKTFSNVITVQEVADTNAIDIKSSYAYYAENIGLILEERAILFDQADNDNDKPWNIKADRGFILRKALVSYKIN